MSCDVLKNYKTAFPLSKTIIQAFDTFILYISEALTFFFFYFMVLT